MRIYDQYGVIKLGSTGSGGTPANPTASVGLAAVNGSATTYMRSDAAPALDVTIAPTWTARHTFTKTRAAVGDWALLLSSNVPSIGLNQTTGAANNRLWSVAVGGESFSCAIKSDDELTNTNWLVVDRTGTTVDTINFPNGTLQYGGIEVGYKDLAASTFSGNYTAVTGDRATMLLYIGTGGHTLTLDNSIATGSVITVVHGNTGNLSIAGSSTTINWFNGSGTISTGTRTLAAGGWITAYKRSSGQWYLVGAGLS